MNIQTKYDSLNTEAQKQVETFIEFVSIQPKSKNDWWNEISIEEKQEIEEGLAQADNGELVSHKTVMEKYKKWL